MQTPRPHGRTGHAVKIGLMRIAMKDKAIDAQAKCKIAERFDRRGCLLPLFHADRGKRFSPQDRAVIHMGDGCHFKRPHRVFGGVAGVEWVARPKLGHRLAGLRRIGELVA